jgi:hypothetical protein
LRRDARVKPVHDGAAPARRPNASCPALSRASRRRDAAMRSSLTFVAYLAAIVAWTHGSSRDKPGHDASVL